MAFARFYKLDEDKQTKILSVALEEFTAHGYENASLNRIISQSGISKGSFYYYFEDKADLLITVMRTYVSVERFIHDSGVLEATDAPSYWNAVKLMADASIEFARTHPHLIKLGEIFHQIDEATRAQGQMATFMEEMGAITASMIIKGQEVGALRTDIPVPIMLQLWFAVDNVFNRWFLAEVKRSEDRLSDIATISLDFFKRAFSQ